MNYNASDNFKINFLPKTAKLSDYIVCRVGLISIAQLDFINSCFKNSHKNVSL
ncbi:unnamed protein product [Moneuplotes crassus]|uniref:Uncharacterized protein n=1 Tax=Euplotes crassus TaxID=5936 RepID=A0AAD1XQ02_EUPCR|nr:unnamed protein product [Moneuplotes crassus]